MRESSPARRPRALLWPETELPQKIMTLAQDLELEIVDQPDPDYLLLEKAESGWQLAMKSPQGWIRYQPDFDSTAALKQKGQTNQLLLKACQALKPQKQPLKILDGTAGWGRDASLLARHGCEVVLVEQQAIVHFLLHQALSRSQSLKPLSLNLIHQNTFSYLQQCEHPFDVIYLDPMFGWHNKSSRPSKDMQLLQQLGENVEIEALAEKALGKARSLVIKRDTKAAPLLAGPHHQLAAGVVRFDVYQAY